MKVKLRMMVQDPLGGHGDGVRLAEGYEVESESFFLDGPVSRRVSVLDFDPQTGQLAPGARFQRPGQRRKLGCYPEAEGDDIRSLAFMQVSVFATVLRTMEMYEKPDTLGRPVTWGFEAPQLLVVPRAGQMENAFYERESHSLQFFYFPSPEPPHEIIYTSLSRDIVAHETGHAILDGIAPDLYDCITPQSLALHEGVADLTALFLSFQSRNLSESILNRTGGSIRDSTAFSSVAEQFGSARDPLGRAGALRNLLNEKTLDPNDLTNRVSRSEPHALSEVLTGALYSVMVRMHEDRKRSLLAAAPESTEVSVSGRALAISGMQFKRMVFRALDYLPPGEVSFADYARAIVAADQAAHPDDPQERAWICEEFVRRHMAPNTTCMEVETNFDYPALREVDLNTLVDSDWAAYAFAEKNRDFLNIPAGKPFRVLPRLDVSKLYYHRGAQKTPVRECIFKVSWNHEEQDTTGIGGARRRQIPAGTMLAIDWETKRVRARLTSEVADASLAESAQAQHADRERLIRELAGRGLLRVTGPAEPAESLFTPAVRVETVDGVMHVRGASRMLHIAREASDG